jgi:hypothetical protein
MQQMTEHNYILQAMKAYDNPSCQAVEEFKEDLNRTKYIKRLLNRYVRSGILKERLLLNHIIIFCNTFGNEMAVRLLFFKLDPSLYSALKSFLVFLYLMPEKIIGVSDKTIYSSDIQIDMQIVNVLRKI